jgi:hypothetical protein
MMTLTGSNLLAVTINTPSGITTVPVNSTSMEVTATVVSDGSGNPPYSVTVTDANGVTSNALAFTI